MLYQPPEITLTYVQQGPYKRSHKAYGFHHAATRKERALLLVAVHPESPQGAPQCPGTLSRRIPPSTAEVVEEKQRVHGRSSKATVCHGGDCPRSSLTFTWGNIYHMLRSSAEGSLRYNIGRNH